MAHRVLVPVPLMVGAVAFTLGCAPSDSPSGEWSDVTDSTAARTLVESPSICNDCIVVEQVVVMGDTAGPGFVVEAMSATRDSLGNYWVGQADAVKVFDAAGRFVRQVGRAGQGPMEFGRFPAPLYTDADGRVHIMDRRNIRETIVGPKFELFADRRLPGLVQAAAPLANGRLVVNLLLPTNGSAGFPLHIVEGPEVLHSFGGSVDGSPRLPSQFTSRRFLATDTASFLRERSG